MSDDTKQTQEVKAKRTAKNSVFLDLFQDKKNLLKLYKALHPEDTDATEDIINQYIIFCKVFDEQRKLYGMTEQTVRETIRICKDRNILKEYLMNREMEVVTIMMSLFDDEQIMKTYWKDVENTLTDKITRKVTDELTDKITGELTDKITHDKDRETAERLIKKGKMSLEDIADCVPALSFDELKEIETEVMQLA